MSQCVPSWNLEHPHQSQSLPRHAPSLDYEVAELTWENGQPSLHGLGHPRASINKHAAISAAAWENHPPHSSAATGDTLESVVNQATTRRHKLSSSAGNELDPWYEHQEAAVVGVPSTATTKPSSHHHARSFMDALVPCSNSRRNPNDDDGNDKEPPGISTCMVGSCSGARTRVNVRLELEESFGGVANEFSGGGGRRGAAAVEGSEYLGGGGFTSEMSPDGTSSGGGEYTRTSGDDSVCHSMSQRDTGDEEIVVVKKRLIGKSSVATKRSRAAAIHNQSERRRRDKINQRIKTLQKLVPNSSKTDKASILDEVIKYLKQLQAQVLYFTSSRIMPHQHPMTSSMLPYMMNMVMLPPSPSLVLGLGLGLGNNNNVVQTNPSFLPSTIIGPPWDINSDAFSAFLACQQTMQPMNMDAYSRLAALYQHQQFQQPPPSGS